MVDVTSFESDILIQVRNYNYDIIGHVRSFETLSCTTRYNDIGEWSIDLLADSPGAQLLSRTGNQGGGVVITRNGQLLLSGPARYHRKSYSGSSPGLLTVAGPDDNWYLGSAVVFPNPAKDPHDMTVDDPTTFKLQYRVPGGSIPSEDILRDLVLKNLSTSAPLVWRRLHGLTVAASQGRGRVHGSHRYHLETTLLEALQLESTYSRTGTDASTELGFRIVQVGEALQFQVYNRVNRKLTARFSFDYRTLADGDYTTTAAVTTYGVIGVEFQEDADGKTGKYPSQYVSYSNDDSYYPHRCETFIDGNGIDSTDSDFQAQVDEIAQEAFDQGSGQIGASITPRETTNLRFGVDYFVGDHVTVQFPDEPAFVAPVRAGTVTYSKAGETIDLGIGSSAGEYSRNIPSVYRRIDRIEKATKKSKSRK